MSQPAPYKRTRVYIACTCLSDEYEQKPCERMGTLPPEVLRLRRAPRVRLRRGYAYGSSPSPMPGTQGPPYAASPPSLPSMSQMPGAAFSTNPSARISPANLVHLYTMQITDIRPTGRNFLNLLFVHRSIFDTGLDSAFALLDPAIAAGVEGDTLLETSINSQTITSKLDSFFENLLTVVKIGFYAPLISAFFELRDDVLKNAESSVHARYTVCRKRNNSAISSHANLKVVSP
ncbi:hypothetical protein C8F04DRAFT_1202452 [Mycena alexandri]|uniref:Uncharacterized protein n=1 Tax=Mycena alexandri TaxID=1745969 RepID=A0AAD6RY06_9AGAR|nr:hypothetical protein C8F04DRAFT_1202452 [Mycena alexandri]